jgi:hypothetical protein
VYKHIQENKTELPDNYHGIISQYKKKRRAEQQREWREKTRAAKNINLVCIAFLKTGYASTKD